MLVMRGLLALFAPFSLHSASWRRNRSTIFVLLLAVGGLAAQSQKPAPGKASSRLASAIERTLDQGHDAILPPHVSHLLGISPDEHEVPVKQFVEMGAPIRGFEVSTAEHNDVVMFVESLDKKDRTFYLVSSRGVLRKVLSIIDGVGYDRPPTAADKAAFEPEKQHWLDVLAPKQP